IGDGGARRRVVGGKGVVGGGRGREGVPDAVRDPVAGQVDRHRVVGRVGGVGDVRGHGGQDREGAGRDHLGVIGVVVGGGGGCGVVLGQCRSAPRRRRLEGARVIFQVPVPAEGRAAGGVGGGRHVGPSECAEPVDERRAGRPGGDVAAPQEQI